MAADCGLHLHLRHIVAWNCRCCNDANAFFGANCLDQRFIYNTAISPSYGFTDDSLRAGKLNTVNVTSRLLI